MHSYSHSLGSGSKACRFATMQWLTIMCSKFTRLSLSLFSPNSLQFSCMIGGASSKWREQGTRLNRLLVVHPLYTLTVNSPNKLHYMPYNTRETFGSALVSFPDPNNPSADHFQYCGAVPEAIRAGVVWVWERKYS